MNKPTQPDKKSMEEKIKEIVARHAREQCDCDLCSKEKVVVKQLLALFTESLKGMSAMQEEKIKPNLVIQDGKLTRDLAVRNGLRQEIISELERSNK